MVQQPVLDDPAVDASTQVESFWPSAPESVLQTGLPAEFLGELVLKSLFVGGPATLEELGERVGTSYSLTDELTTHLKTEQSIEATSATGYSDWGIRYRLTGRGTELAQSALERSRYVGIVPVMLAEYTRMTQQQALRRNPPTPKMLEQAFAPFVLSAVIKDSLARIFYSGRTVLIFGDSGNGKTSIVESYAKTFVGAVLFPHALYVAGQVIRIYDPVRHQMLPLESQSSEIDDGVSLLRGAGHPTAFDRRWIKIRRPVVLVGGELEVADLNLTYDATTRQYQAPAHMKAQDGIFMIDDFGRQRARPEEILNRWIVPLESGTDTLTLQTGESFSIPFEMALIFASNLKPKDLADEAFLRRLPYKMNLPGPDRELFSEIARMWCRRLEIAFEEEDIGYLTDKLFNDPKIQPRATHPRDLGLMILDYARYDHAEAALTRDYVDKACSVYFIYDS
ncbi:MAG TPA: ATPase [Dehalococcoidia bacterium]|nr:ATPase [Dehalococcoidia bacterium]